MRCKACDKMLQEWELHYTSRDTGEHLDLCGQCLGYSNKALSDWDAIVDTEVDSSYNLEEDLFFEYVDDRATME